MKIEKHKIVGTSMNGEYQTKLVKVFKNKEQLMKAHPELKKPNNWQRLNSHLKGRTYKVNNTTQKFKSWKGFVWKLVEDEN